MASMVQDLDAVLVVAPGAAREAAARSAEAPMALAAAGAGGGAATEEGTARRRRRKKRGGGDDNGEEGGGSARAGRTPSAQRAGAEEAVEAAAPAPAEAMLMDEAWDEGSDGSMSDAIAPRRCGS